MIKLRQEKGGGGRGVEVDVFEWEPIWGEHITFGNRNTSALPLDPFESRNG